MEVCYADFTQDIDHYRRLGADDDALVRSEGLLNHYFLVIQQLDELERRLELKNAHIARLQEQLFGPNTPTDDDLAEEPHNSPKDKNNPSVDDDDSEVEANDEPCDEADKNVEAEISNGDPVPKEKKTRTWSFGC